MARRLCTDYVDPELIQPLIACRLIPLSKNPGVRPIGVCETLRRILGKAILRVVGPYIRQEVGMSQLCAGQRSGCETAVHAMTTLFEENDSTEGVLLVDASNAFNSLNRGVMLRNIRELCPAFSTCVTNFYRSSASLFVGGETIQSPEGTTQGDPLAMAIYALATLPLINRAKLSAGNATQCWFADDAGAGGKLRDLFNWWCVLAEKGPLYGYFVNPPKTWLVVKDCRYASATALFQNSGIQITTEGLPLLGAPLGNVDYCTPFLKSKSSSLVQEVRTLARIARTEPQAAYSAFTHGLAGKWNYLTRVSPTFREFLEPLESTIRTEYLASLTGRCISDLERSLLHLPARLGGLAVCNPCLSADHSFQSTSEQVKPVVDYILDPESTTLEDALPAQSECVANARERLKSDQMRHAEDVFQALSQRGQRAMELSQERGASSWLTALPLASHGFSLSKGEFRDALCMRYGWTPDNIPTHCTDGEPFAVEHALSCTRGGYVALRHNELRDLFADLLRETSTNVSVEPELQPLSGEVFQAASAVVSDGARLDIKASGFWASRHEVDFFDVRVFNPLAPSYQHQSVDQTYANHERQKMLAYGESEASRARHFDSPGVHLHGRRWPLRIPIYQEAGVKDLRP